MPKPIPAIPISPFPAGRNCAPRAGGRRHCCGCSKTCCRSARTRTIWWSMPRSGKAARNWASHKAIVETLLEMDEDQTLIIQSGKPIGLLKTHAKAPLVIMANCNIVGQWAKAEVFYELEKKGLICWGGLTAGAWQYIGSQGVIQGTYEIFMRIAENRFGGDLAGPLHPDRRAWRHGRRAAAGRAHGGRGDPLRRYRCGTGAQAQGDRLSRRDRAGPRYGAGDDRRGGAAKSGPTSIGLVGNAADIYPEIVRRGIVPDIVTDQTSAHDLVYGYVPKGMSLAEVRRLREEGPSQLMAASRASIVDHVRGHAGLPEDGRRSVRQRQSDPHAGASEGGVENAFDIPIFTEAYLRPLFARAIGPFRWMALSGEAERYSHDRRPAAGDVPGQPDRHQLDQAGARACALRGPAGAHRLARPWRAHGAGAGGQRPGGGWRADGAGGLLAATISMPAPWRIPIS